MRRPFSTPFDDVASLPAPGCAGVRRTPSIASSLPERHAKPLNPFHKSSVLFKCAGHLFQMLFLWTLSLCGKVWPPDVLLSAFPPVPNWDHLSYRFSWCFLQVSKHISYIHQSTHVKTTLADVFKSSNRSNVTFIFGAYDLPKSRDFSIQKPPGMPCWSCHRIPSFKTDMDSFADSEALTEALQSGLPSNNTLLVRGEKRKG